VNGHSQDRRACLKGARSRRSFLAQRDGQIDVISLCDANEGALYR
jgi:hypothetical protein